MPYVIAEPCVGVKDKSCVAVCPVDCIHGNEDDDQLFIDPAECIDCGLCEPECPVDAIKPDTEDEPDGKWLEVNARYSKIWPNITLKGDAPADAAQFEREQGKFEKYFSEAPGKGS